MAGSRPTPLHPLTASAPVRRAAAALIDAVEHAGSERSLPAASYDKAVKELERLRGRPLAFPFLASGQGQGARVRLADGSTKLDFIGGIGVQVFGHSDRDLLETAVVAAAADVVYQGHLQPGPEYLRLSRALRRAAGRKLCHVWLAVSGAMANENAQKMIFQRRAPADIIIAFEGGFHGRTLAMAELTDRPAFRDGLPTRGKVLYVPFYDPGDETSIERSLEVLNAHLQRYPGQVAGMCFEIVQGEGGFRTAPHEFFAALMERCRQDQIAVWIDEIQSFARTGELFAFQTLGLGDYVDIATVGKLLQGSATLFSKAYNPRPGLVAGTYAGATVGMAVGARILDRLQGEGYLGTDGRVALLGRRIQKRFAALRKQIPGAVGEVTGLGAMLAFVPLDGSPEATRAVLQACFEEGLILLSAGSNPSKIRMLPPLNTTDEELTAAFTVLEKALQRVADDRG